MKTLENRGKMNKSFLVITLCLLLSILFISQASASCRVAFYTKDLTGSLINTNSVGICDNSGEIIKINNQQGGLLQFGNPADTCQSRCGNVYVSAESGGATSLQGPHLIGYAPNFPMNKYNTKEWDKTSTKYINITLDNVNKIKSKTVPVPEKLKIETTQQRTERIINSLDNKNKISNKEKLVQIQTPTLISSSKISFIEQIINWFRNLFT